MADNSGICYTWSGDKKLYESGELSISPDKVKFVDFDNRYAKPFISNIFTSSNNPPGISLEEGTAMYTVGLRDSDIDINNNNYLTYTPPDGYELVSEDMKNDPGVEEYYMSKFSPAYIVSATQPATQDVGDFWFKVNKEITA